MNNVNKILGNVFSMFFGVLLVAFMLSWIDVLFLKDLGRFEAIYVLSLVETGLLYLVWKKTTEYWEDLMRTSFDEDTIKRAKWLKRKRDEEYST